VRLRDCRARELSLVKQFVDLVATLYELAEAEFASRRRTKLDFSVASEIVARVQAQNQAVVELEECNGAARAGASV
jgi:hypothetical protein